MAKVHALQTEVARGEDANDEKVADLVSEIDEAAPAALNLLVSLFTNSVVAKTAGGAAKC
jgi:hypothetical protein